LYLRGASSITKNTINFKKLNFSGQKAKDDFKILNFIF
jgi:hypothetical protein